MEHRPSSDDDDEDAALLALGLPTSSSNEEQQKSAAPEQHAKASKISPSRRSKKGQRAPSSAATPTERTAIEAITTGRSRLPGQQHTAFLNLILVTGGMMMNSNSMYFVDF